MRKHLTADELAVLLDGTQLATLATTRADGSVLLSPVWYEWRDGGFTIVIEADDMKSRHIQRDPRVTIIVAEQVVPYRSFEVRGSAALTRPADLHDTLRRIAIRYLGAAAGSVYADDMRNFAGELLRLEPGVIRGWDYADAL